MEFLKSVASESIAVSVRGTDFSVDFVPVCRKCNSLLGLLCSVAVNTICRVCQ